MTLEEFREELINNINSEAQIDSDYPAEKFIEYCKDILMNDFGLLSDLDITFIDWKTSNNKFRNMRLDASYLEKSINTLHLLYSDYNAGPIDNINNEFVNQKRTLLENYFYNVLNGYFINAAESDPTTELARSIRKNIDDIKKIHIIIISTNKKSERLKTTFECKSLEIGTRVYDVDLTLLDIEGIFQTKLAGFKKDDIFIKTSDFNNAIIPCIKADIESEDYDSYLAVVPGAFLSDIYLKYNARLLESNVRSFLNTRGKINKGILNTILNQKDRFFAYNNGISTTADEIELEERNGVCCISSFKNLQIINGGQTTASLAAATLKNSADLSGIYVQMKLSIIKDTNKKSELVRLIAMYANRQNKVTDADLNSNHPFYQRIEDFSRKIKTPLAANTTVQSIWFFERARGQYDQAKMQLKTKREREIFELQNPKCQKFTKTDLAKYINASDMRPFDVSWGAEVNMTKFGVTMQKDWEKSDSVFNENYYKNLIAKAIVFKRIEQIISNEEWYIENKGYRAQLVPYTFSKFVFEIKKLKRNFNYRKVWELQALPEIYEDDIKGIAKLCFDAFYDNSRPITNVGEYAKREICWNKIKETNFNLSTDVISNLITDDEKEIEERVAKKEQAFDNEVSAEIEIYNLGIDYWNKVIEIGTQLKELTQYEISLCEIAIKYIKQIYKMLSKKQTKEIMAVKKKMEQYL